MLQQQLVGAKRPTLAKDHPSHTEAILRYSQREFPKGIFSKKKQREIFSFFNGLCGKAMGCQNYFIFNGEFLLFVACLIVCLPLLFLSSYPTHTVKTSNSRFQQAKAPFPTQHTHRYARTPRSPPSPPPGGAFPSSSVISSHILPLLSPLLDIALRSFLFWGSNEGHFPHGRCRLNEK